MPKTNTERQRKYREKMRAHNLTLVQVWVPQDRILEIKSAAVRMQEEGSQDFEPSRRQLAFAQFLCDKKGLTLTRQHLKSSKKLSKWLNENKNKPDRTKRKLRLINSNIKRANEDFYRIQSARSN